MNRIKQAFNILNMGSDPDLSTSARIRNAAILRYASDGMNASIRSIAAEAGVSPGLVIHHFGSTQGLQEACTDHVLAMIKEAKTSVLQPTDGPAVLLGALASIEGYAPLVGYTLRYLQSGGERVATFVDQFVSDAKDYMEDAASHGIVSSTRFPSTRARVLAEQALGALLLNFSMTQQGFNLETLPAWLRSYYERATGPMLEVYTEPLLLDSTLLDSYLANRSNDSIEQHSEPPKDTPPKEIP